MSVQTTGVHSLYQVEPTVLLGVVSCLVSGPLSGWIAVDLAIESDELRFVAETPCLEMSEAVGMQLAALLQRVAHQSRELLPGLSSPVQHEGEGTSVTICGQRGEIVVFGWTNATIRSIHHKVHEDMVNIRLHPATAVAVGSNILKTLAINSLRLLGITSAENPQPT